MKILYDGQERLWHTAVANLDAGYFGLIFEFRFATLYSPDNAGLDKISITPGECQPAGEWCGSQRVRSPPRSSQKKLAWLEAPGPFRGGHCARDDPHGEWKREDKHTGWEPWRGWPQFPCSASLPVIVPSPVSWRITWLSLPGRPSWSFSQKCCLTKASASLQVQCSAIPHDSTAN